MVLDVGRICVKTAGRDAAQFCAVVEVLDDTFVLVDGNTRRKKVNKAHIEPTNKTVDIKKGATTKDVLAAFEKAGLEVTKSAEKKEKKEKQPQVKKTDVKKEEKKAKKSSKKE